MKKHFYRKAAVKLLVTIIAVVAGNFPRTLPAQTPAAVTAEIANSAISARLPLKICGTIIAETTANQFASDNVSNVYLPLLNGKLLSLNLKTIGKIWEADLGGSIISDPLISVNKKSIYVLTEAAQINEFRTDNDIFDNNKENVSGSSIILRSLSLNTGLTNWQVKLESNFTSGEKFNAFIEDEKILLADQNGSMTALRLVDGSLIWKNELKKEHRENFQFILQDKKLIGFSKGFISLFSTETGSKLFETNVKDDITAAYLSEKLLIYGTGKGGVYGLNLNEKKNLWKFRTGGKISNLTITPRGLLVSSFDNFLYLIEPASGGNIWKKRLDGRIIIKPLLFPVDSVVVITLGSSRANFVDLESGRLINRIYTNSEDVFADRPYFIDDSLVFKTGRGLIVYKNLTRNCS